MNRQPLDEWKTDAASEASRTKTAMGMTNMELATLLDDLTKERVMCNELYACLIYGWYHDDRDEHSEGCPVPRALAAMDWLAGGGVVKPDTANPGRRTSEPTV